MPGPVGNTPPRHVARPNDHIGAGLCCGEHLWQCTGVMREVSIDLNQGIESLTESPREARPVGAAETRLFSPSEHVDRPELSLDRLGNLGGTVGAAIVDDQDHRLWSMPTHRPQHDLNVHALVVGRDDHQRLHMTVLAHGLRRAISVFRRR